MPEYCVGMFFYALMYERVVHVFIKVRGVDENVVGTTTSTTLLALRLTCMPTR